MSIAKTIGSRIRSLRTKAGLSQMDVALKAGVATSYFSALERGEKNATIQTLSQVADALDVTFEEVVAGELVEIDRLLAEVPSRQRAAMTKLLREAVLLIRQAANDASGKRR